QGRHRTALAPDELVTEIAVPCQAGEWSYQKFHRDTLDWALVAVAAVRSGPGREVRVALANMADTPVRAVDVERAIADGRPAGDAARLAARDDRPLPADPRASEDYRRHLARVLTARALVALGL